MGVDDKKRICIVGGGISGCLSAIKLSQNNKLLIDIFEKKSDILSGPPFCHLHAGGMLYPMISLQDSEELLYDSLMFAEMFDNCLEKRPTVIAYRKTSGYSVGKLILKCKMMQYCYSNWSKNNYNKLPIGSIDSYYEIYTREDMINFKNGSRQIINNYHDRYVEKFCKYLNNIDDIQYPFVSVNEYGISLSLVKEQIKHNIGLFKNIKVYNNTDVITLSKTSVNTKADSNNTWSICTAHPIIQHEYDFVINASGYNINTLRNTNENKDYFLELKSSWLIKNDSLSNIELDFPEIAILGERNTENGMVQITPLFQNNEMYYQIHCMKNNITLFPDGCAHSDNVNEFYYNFKDLLSNNKFSEKIIKQRTLVAIKEISKLFKIFEASKVHDTPLWGIQRIPGKTTSKRTYSIVSDHNYIEIHIVKGISSVSMSEKLSQSYFFEK